MKKIMKKDFQKTGEKIERLFPKLRQECSEYISEILKEKGSINLDDDSLDPIYIGYDGGRHPENSNLYSQVYDVHLSEDGKPVLCMEDSGAYGIERCDTMDLYYIAMAIDDLLGNT